MTGRGKQPGPGKKLMFSGVVLVGLLVVGETVARILHYQIRGRSGFALVEACRWLQDRMREGHRAEQVAHARPFVAVYAEARRQLDGEQGEALRVELESIYAAEFQQLASEVAAVGSQLLVVDFLLGRATPRGRFFAEVAGRCGVDYFDVAHVLRGVPPEHALLGPADGHLTGYANQLVAVPLARRLDAYAGRSSGRSYSGDPALLGNAYQAYGGVDRRQLVTLKPDLGFCLIRNAQGFRMVEDLEIPKRRQRVLCLGDSYTFGDHLNNQDTLPAILARLRPNLEVLNAGISGYTVTDELALFRERAKFAAPDVTVLQVCDNDLIELTAFVRNLIGSGRGERTPSEAERQFFARVDEELANKGG